MKNLYTADLKESQLVRVEIGISLNQQRRRLVQVISHHYKKLGFEVIRQKNNSLLGLYFKNETVVGFFSRHRLSKIEINHFFEHIKVSVESINADSKIYDLGEQQIRALRLYVSICKSQKIVIETSGMYLSILIMTHSIIKEFIKKGGQCVEIAYPHLEINHDLDKYICQASKVIKFGEMRIKNQHKPKYLRLTPFNL